MKKPKWLTKWMEWPNSIEPKEFCPVPVWNNLGTITIEPSELMTIPNRLSMSLESYRPDSLTIAIRIFDSETKDVVFASGRYYMLHPGARININDIFVSEGRHYDVEFRFPDSHPPVSPLDINFSARCISFH